MRIRRMMISDVKTGCYFVNKLFCNCWMGWVERVFFLKRKELGIPGLDLTTPFMNNSHICNYYDAFKSTLLNP